MVEAGAEELDELADHPLLAQNLGDRQHEVRRRGPLLHATRHPEADHFGDQHRDRLAQHRRLGLDPADPPAEHRKAVDHGGVAVRPDQGVGIGDGDAVGTPGPHHLREILEVDLVADAGARRHHPEIGERLLPPAEELVPLAVAFELQVDVFGESLGTAEAVDHHRMIDHQVDRHQRIDLRGIGAAGKHRIAHRREVDDGGNAGEVLHQDPRRSEGDLPLGAPALQPRGDGADILDGDGAAVLPAEQVLKQDLERVRQPRQVAERRGRGREAEVLVAPAADLQGAACLQTVLAILGHRVSPLPGCNPLRRNEYAPEPYTPEACRSAVARCRVPRRATEAVGAIP